MRAAAGGNPLDLNNLPGDQDHGRLLFDDTSSSAPPGEEGGRRRRNGIGGSNDESGKVYECRFCSLKFGKSQALGGHMNRHRQERETETLNRARQLVFTTDNLIPSPTHLLGGQPVMQHGGYHPQPGQDPYRSMYPAPRLFSGSSSSTIIPPPPPPSFMYAQSSGLAGYPPPHYNINPQPLNDCLVGHVLPGANTQSYANYTATPQDNNYTCIGAPISYGKRSDMGSTLPNNNNFGNNIEEGIDEGDQMALNMNMGRSFARGGGGTSPMINNRYN